MTVTNCREREQYKLNCTHALVYMTSMAGNMTRAEAATFIPHETSPIPEALISSKILSLKARLLWVPECSPAYGVQEWELIDHPCMGLLGCKHLPVKSETHQQPRS